MVEGKRISIVRPTLETPYHIDFEWWGKSDRDWRVYLRSYLCQKHQQVFADMSSDGLVDWVDPDTAEVRKVDGLQQVLISHCAKQEEFIMRQTTLVDSVFRIFLANGNQPLTPVDLSRQLGRDPLTILKTISGVRVYKGLRPFVE